MYEDKQKSNTKNEEIEQSISPYAKLPLKILYDKDLTDKQKLIFGSINALSNKTGVCFASNSYLARMHDCDERTVIRTVNKLVEKSYISKNLIHGKSKKQVIRRELTINDFSTDSTDSRVLSTESLGTDSRVPRGTVSNVTDNIINNKYNKTNNIYSRADGKNEKIIISIINYLNKKTDKNYKSTTQKTKSLINARIKEGFTLDDFKKVIDTKTAQWKNDDYWNKFLRPGTLFGNNFESYLQENNSKSGNMTNYSNKRNQPNIKNELKKYDR